MPKVQISCDTPEVSIYYSINNNNLDQLYTTPFEVIEECTIQAIGKKNGYEESEIANKEIIKLPDPVTHNSGRNTYIDNISTYEELLGDTINDLYFLGGISFVQKTTYNECISNNYIVVSSGKNLHQQTVKLVILII